MFEYCNIFAPKSTLAEYLSVCVVPGGNLGVFLQQSSSRTRLCGVQVAGEEMPTVVIIDKRNGNGYKKDPGPEMFSSSFIGIYGEPRLLCGERF